MIRYRIEIVIPGDPPPCLRPDFGICRGCSGWQAMLRAAEEDPAWRRGPVHCTVTGLEAQVREIGSQDSGD